MKQEDEESPQQTQVNIADLDIREVPIQAYPRLLPVTKESLRIACHPCRILALGPEVVAYYSSTNAESEGPPPSRPEFKQDASGGSLH